MTNSKFHNGFHNNGPVGERDFEDAGNEAMYPPRASRQVLASAKALTPETLNARRQKENVIASRMVADYTRSKGFAPNTIMMSNIRRDAALEAKS